MDLGQLKTPRRSESSLHCRPEPPSPEAVNEEIKKETSKEEVKAKTEEAEEKILKKCLALERELQRLEQTIGKELQRVRSEAFDAVANPRLRKMQQD